MWILISDSSITHSIKKRLEIARISSHFLFSIGVSSRDVPLYAYRSSATDFHPKLLYPRKLLRTKNSVFLHTYVFKALLWTEFLVTQPPSYINSSDCAHFLAIATFLSEIGSAKSAKPLLDTSLPVKSLNHKRPSAYLPSPSDAWKVSR